MSEYRFILEPYKTMKDKYHCPNCNKKTFTRYIDIETKKHINNKVGICSRIIKCNYHYTPKFYFKDNSFSPKMYTSNNIKTKTQQIETTSYIDLNILNLSIQKSNNFIHFLEQKLFGKEITEELINLYKIGTSKNWNGATVFWQIDIKGKIRTGKIMLYNSENGKRIKKINPNWVHSVLKIKDFNLTQCFFGEHLLNDDLNKPVAIVESEKTAIISSIYIPDFIWLACGSVNNLSEQKTKVLKGRNVVLFPDLKCYNLWYDKISTLTKLANFKVSDLLEKNASTEEKSKGYDLADYLINLKIDYKKYL